MLTVSDIGVALNLHHNIFHNPNALMSPTKLTVWGLYFSQMLLILNVQTIDQVYSIDQMGISRKLMLTVEKKQSMGVGVKSMVS